MKKLSEIMLEKAKLRQILDSGGTSLRLGQNLMINCFEYSNELYKFICKDPLSDCFYEDAKIKNTLKKIDSFKLGAAKGKSLEDDIDIEDAINFLKSKGYKIFKETVELKEV